MSVFPNTPISTNRVALVPTTGPLQSRGAIDNAAGLSRKAAIKADTYQQFEALILKQFVEAMLPKDTESVYGSGFTGSAWKSMLADKIAAVIAKRGSLGIAKELFATGTTSREVDGAGYAALSAPQSLAAKPVDAEQAREPGK